MSKEQLKEYFDKLKCFRKEIEIMAENVALFDESIANDIFDCIAAEISNKEDELHKHLL